MPSHWTWDQSPPKDSLEVWGVEAFIVRTNPPPSLDEKYKMKTLGVIKSLDQAYLKWIRFHPSFRTPTNHISLPTQV